MKVGFHVFLQFIILIEIDAANVNFGKIINPHEFKYIRNPGSQICSDNKGSNIFLLVYVHTAPSNFKNRLAIRETWSQKTLFKANMMRVVFMMGKNMDDTLNSLLDLEYELFNDIIQEDFHDSYRNLTYKGRLCISLY